MCASQRVRVKNMRTTRLFTIVATLVAAGFLVLATTSNAAFAQASTSTNGPSNTATATSLISQSNSNTATCTAGTYNFVSCNQAASNVNQGNVVSAVLTR
jgi:hypothetical protein